MKIDWQMYHVREPNDGVTADRGKVLMVLDEFHRFYFLMKHLCQYTFPPAVYIMSGSEQGANLKLKRCVQDNTPKIGIHINRPDILGQAGCERFFGELRKIIGGGHNLSITSVDPDDAFATSESLATLKKHMAPPLIWFHSLQMHQLETAHQLRDNVYKHFDRNTLQGAQFEAFAQRHDLMALSTVIWKILGDIVFLQDELGQVLKAITISPEYGAATIASLPFLASTIFENVALLLTTGITLSSNPLPRPGGMLDLLGRWHEDFGVKWIEKEKLQHNHLPLVVYLFERPHFRVGQLRAELQELVDKMDGFAQHYERAIRDIATIEPYLDQNNTVS